MRKNNPSILIITISIIIFLISFFYIQYGAYLRPEFLIQNNYVCTGVRCYYQSLRDLFLLVIIIPIGFFLFWAKSFRLTDKDDKNYFKVEGEKPKLLYKNIFYALCLILIYIGTMLYYTYLVFWQ